MNRHCCFKTI